VSGVAPESVAAVRDLRIDQGYLREVVTAISAIGSSELGFRTTGTPEDAAVAELVAGRMREIGLADVAVEPVTVHGWRFLGAHVRTTGGADATFRGSSWGGVTPTPPGGVRGPLVDVGTGLRRRLDRLDLSGAVAMVEWRSRGPAPYVVAMELMRRGAAAMVLTCPDKGEWWQSPRALGAFDAHWPAGGPPMVFLAKEDAASLHEQLRTGPVDAEVVLEADVDPAAQGYNVVGYWPGRAAGPIVVGAHHDGWFSGAFDNASGVAVTLAMAKALADADLRLPYTVCFSTRTGEEFGIADSSYDWCIGAWEQVHTTHPDWADTAPLHLCIEATGWPGLRAIIETSVELAGWSRRICRAADAEGWLKQGWRIGPPVSGTELWPYLVSGVPSVATYAWETSFAHTDYHSQFDTVDRLDFDHVAAQTRLYLLFLLEAARDPDGIFDHGARARQLRRIGSAERTRHDGLVVAADRHAGRRGRAAFTAVGRHLVALDAHGHVSHPHEQAAGDLAALEAALAALEAGDRSAATRQLARVGVHALSPYASAPTFAAVAARSAPAAAERSWARNSHLTVSPDLWDVLATIRAEPDAKPFGPWVQTALTDAITASRTELDRRLDAMTTALESTPSEPTARSS
jgi:hypothetical protein